MIITLELPDDSVDLGIMLIRRTTYYGFNVSQTLEELPKYDRVIFKDDGNGKTEFEYREILI